MNKSYNYRSKIDLLYENNKYYVKINRKIKQRKADYWGKVLDPDKKIRNRISLKEKKLFKENILNELNFIKKINIGKVLDIGCNTGEFLSLASKHNAEAHGIDIDENSINYIQKNINSSNISVSHVNISNPTPALGWNNNETLGYLEKNNNYFDTVIFLGIVHHLIITDRIPLEKIIELLLKLTKKNLIFEFVSKNDEKFIDLASINLNLYNNFTKDNFEKIIQKSFKIIKIYNLDYNPNRHIYILEKI